MITSLEKCDLSVDSLYRLFLKKEATEDIPDLFDLPEPIKPSNEECGCNEGVVCDCKLELCDTIRNPTIYQHKAHLATLRIS